MDAYSMEVLFDPSKCSKLSIDQKRELVYEVSNWPDGATDILHTWSRHDILQILCAELGKERKYTGLTKSKIIEHLLKIVHDKKSRNQNASEARLSSENVETTMAPDFNTSGVLYCKNSACKARMNRDDTFCKRCSCCICNQYDDNKDPSLWLICNSEGRSHGSSCGLSCHLECAMRHENSGMCMHSEDKGSLDGSFRCVSCGKVNDLLGSWRKQLIVARDTRRVDILCYRVSLAQKILAGTKLYQNLYGGIDEAVKKLEEEVGPLTGLPVKKARGIVNRLSSGPEIQRFCASTVEFLDSMLSERASDMPSDCNALAPKLVRIEDIQSSSLTVILNSEDSNVENVEGYIYMLWHRKADDINYPSEPTCRLCASNTKFRLSDLTPDTDYILKVVSLDKDGETGFCEIQFKTEKTEDEPQNTKSDSSGVERSQSPATNCSSLSNNPSSVEDETNNAMPCGNDDGNKNEKDANNGDVIISFSEEGQFSRMPKSDTANGSSTPKTGLECVPYVNCSEAGLQITPYKTENCKIENGRKNKRQISGKGKRDDEPQAGSSSKKRSGENRDEECKGIGDKDFEFYVKVIRWLECEGHIEASFRQKFLTWYSLRATSKEVRVVKVFIDTFIEDPESLAGQLVDSFSDIASNKRCLNVPAGFCSKLWH